MRRPADYEDEPPTRVETPLPTRYDAETRTYQFRDVEPAPPRQTATRGRRRR